MSGPNLDLINCKTIEIIQDKVESSVRRKTRNRSPRKIKINSIAGGTEGAGRAIVPQDFGLPITEPNLDLIKNKTGSNDKVESSVRRKIRTRSPSKIKINSRAGGTEGAIVPQDFGLPITEPNPDLIKNKTGSNDQVESGIRRRSRTRSLGKIETNTRAGETKGAGPPDFSRIRSKTCTITRPSYITDCPPKLLDLALNSIQKAMDSKSKISQDQVEAKTPSPKTQVKPMSKAQGKQISEKIPIKAKSKIPLSQNQAKKLSDSDDSKSIEKSFQAPNITSRLE